MKKNTLQPAMRKQSLTGVSSSQMAGLYDLEETLGKGHYAIVKKARHVFTGERVAVKVIDKTKLDAVSQKALLKEVVCMKLVQHPNVVRLYEVIDTTTKTYLVLELGHGDLYDLILKQQGGLGEENAKKYFCQIVSAVSYCHKLHVAHRDLKPENVVFFPPNPNAKIPQDGSVKLTDFGFSNKFCPGDKLNTSCGSLAYSAPEILLGDAYDPQKVDIWSLGVILYMLLCGRPPFQEANDSETLTMIMDVKYSIPPTISQECRDLIRRMLVRFPEKRATLKEIENNSWLNKDGYLIKKNKNPLIINCNLTPEERNTIIQRMVSGQIGKREQIVEALQKNEYNHITATFFLLSEKFLRDRGPTDQECGDENVPNTALTASLESLHDHHRKSSGQSDNEELASGEDTDSLAPLDLELTSRKKKSRESSMLGLSDLDKALPIVEENDMVHSEEEDLTGPLNAVGNAIRRRSHYNHRRVIVPQRSQSCSSSEDEDSEKKKRSLPPQKHHHHKSRAGNGRGNGTNPADCCNQGGIPQIRKSRDDESSDEPSRPSCGGSNNTSSNFTAFQNGPSTSGPNVEAGGEPTGTTGGNKDQDITSSTSRRSSSRTSNNTNNSESERENEERKTSLQLAYEYHRQIHIETESPPLDRRPPSIENPPDLLLLHHNHNHEDLDIERYSPHESPILYPDYEALTLRTDEHGHAHNTNKIAKKGRKFFFSWLFPKKKKSSNSSTTSNSNSSNSPNLPLSAGIYNLYKTRSCAELKLKNGQVVARTCSAGPPGSKQQNLEYLDCNQNI